MVIIISNFHQGVDVALRGGANPLGEGKTCCFIMGKDANMTAQCAPICVGSASTRVTIQSKEHTLIHEICQIILGHFESCFGSDGPLQLRNLPFGLANDIART